MTIEHIASKHYPEGIRTQMEFPEKTMPEFLAETAARIPDNVALKFYQKEISYQEFYALSNAFASALQKSGIVKNDRVAIMLPNCPQYAISYFGILKAGGIVTQINPMLLEKELIYLLNDSGAETIVVYAPLFPRIQAIAPHTPLKNIIVVSFDAEKPQVDGAVLFEHFFGRGDGHVEPVAIDPAHDVAVLQYTGGTTGLSKGAMLTHRNITANALQSQEFFKDEVTYGEESCLTVIPLFHVFGMTAAMNLSILNGSKNILLPRFDLQEVLETIKREQPTTFPGVPTMYIAITNHPEAEKYGIDSIHICNSGSAPMPVETMKEFERKTGAKILEGYGLSEASPTTHCNPPFAERKPGSIGIGMPSTEYKVVDLATGETEVPRGEKGELVIRGPQVMKGYWNMPEETENALRDGWLFTGDIATMDEDGYVYIVDRKKDMILSSGYNVYPRDIEEVLYEHPAVQEAVAIGVADPYRGESVKAIIVKKAGQEATEQQIIDWAKEKMAAYKVPKQIEFRSELPKTNVGKILRRALREETAK